MSVYSFGDHCPQIPNTCFIAPSADVIGKVTLGEHVSLWYQVVARGDVHQIEIGENTNIQDLSMLHVIDERALIIGENVSVGHNVTLHACTIEDFCLIGMGAVVLDGARIGQNSLVAAGSLVPPGKEYPPGSMIMGNPAKVVRELTPEEKRLYGNHYLSYMETKDNYLKKNMVKKLSP